MANMYFHWRNKKDRTDVSCDLGNANVIILLVMLVIYRQRKKCVQVVAIVHLMTFERISEQTQEMSMQRSLTFNPHPRLQKNLLIHRRRGPHGPQNLCSVV